MPGTAEAFLKYNKDNVLKHLLAIEAHLRDLDEEYSSEHASCIIKHLLQLEEQCEEGISHASEVGALEDVEKFKKLISEGRRIRKLVEARESPGNLIKEVRKVRSIAESLVGISTQRCATCKRVEEVLKSLGWMVEESNSAHVGSEERLKNPIAKYTTGDSLAEWKPILEIYGSAHLGKGLARGFRELDSYLNASTKPVIQRPGFWLTLATSIVMPLAAEFLKIKEPVKTIMVAVGAFTSTGIWDYIEEMPIAGLGLFTRGATYAPPPPPSPPTALAPAVEKAAETAKATGEIW